MCRLCLLFIAYNHSLALLGHGSFQLQPSSRVSELFDASVDSNDSLPQHVATLEVQAVSGTVENATKVNQHARERWKRQDQTHSHLVS